MPALRPDQLDSHLQQKLSSLYVIHGDEQLFVQEAGDAIRLAARKAGCVEREVFIAERGFKWDQLAASTQNFSLFGEQKLIDLRIPNGKPDSEGAALLEQFGDDASQVILITLPHLDKTTQNSAWFKALEKKGVVIAIYPLQRDDLPRWIAARLKRYRLAVVPEALTLLAEQCEGNLLAARQEIEKLALLYPQDDDSPGKTLTLAEVEQATSDVARFDIFELSEAWLNGDAKRALHLIQALREEGEAPTLIGWQFAEDIHALCAVRAEILQGVPPAQSIGKVRIWGKRKDALLHAARRVPNAALPQLLRRLSDLDALAKGIKFGKQRDFWQMLEDCVLLLAPLECGGLPPL